MVSRLTGLRVGVIRRLAAPTLDWLLSIMMLAPLRGLPRSDVGVGNAGSP